MDELVSVTCCCVTNYPKLSGSNSRQLISHRFCGSGVRPLLQDRSWLSPKYSRVLRSPLKSGRGAGRESATRSLRLSVEFPRGSQGVHGRFLRKDSGGKSTRLKESLGGRALQHNTAPGVPPGPPLCHQGGGWVNNGASMCQNRRSSNSKGCDFSLDLGRRLPVAEPYVRKANCSFFKMKNS